MRVALPIITVVASFIATAGLSPLPGAEITLTSVGTPTWRPVDFHLFSAPVGTGATEYAEFTETLAALLPAPNHVSDPVFGVLPGARHSPPYNTELATGVSNLGFAEKTMFGAAEFSNGIGVYLAYMLVPGPGSPVGSSADYASGPIVPNTVQRIHSDATTFRNGVLFSAAGSFDVKVADGFDGYSHIPNFYADNFDFALVPSAGVLGSYEYRIQLRDTAGNGWDIATPFQVVPEPGTLTMLAIGFIGFVVVRRVRQRFLSARRNRDLLSLADLIDSQSLRWRC